MGFGSPTMWRILYQYAALIYQSEWILCITWSMVSDRPPRVEYLVGLGFCSSDRSCLLGGAKYVFIDCDGKMIDSCDDKWCHTFIFIVIILGHTFQPSTIETTAHGGALVVVVVYGDERFQSLDWLTINWFLKNENLISVLDAGWFRKLSNENLWRLLLKVCGTFTSLFYLELGWKECDSWCREVDYGFGFVIFVYESLNDCVVGSNCRAIYF